MADNNKQQLQGILKKAGKSKNESAKKSKAGRAAKKPSHQRYVLENKGPKHKIEKLAKYCERNPLDLQAAARLKVLTAPPPPPVK